MSLIQVNTDVLLDFINILEKVAPLGRPQNDQDLESIQHWEQVAITITEICQPISHEAGFDSATTYWSDLSTSYRREAQDYLAQRGTS
jgi:hypothetical protein